MAISKPNNPKQITFVLGGLSGGGAERVATNLIHYWYKKGYKVTLISRKGPEKDFYSIPEKVHRIVLGGEGESKNKIIGLLKNIFYIWKLRSALKTSGSGSVISFMTRTNLQTIFASYGLNRKIILSERNDTSQEQHGWPWHYLREKLYKYADVVTANSSISVSDMKRYVPESKLVLVPNPVFIPYKVASPANSSIILNVGRLVPAKNQELILEALSLLGTGYNNWSLEILGEGEERESLIRKSEYRELSGRITLHGLVKDPDFWYRSATIFVLSSLFEGTPNALLEAMAHNLPCIISDSLPGALELVDHEHTGLVFRSGDAQDLSEKLKRLMDNPELRVILGKAAGKRVQQFSPENVMPVWENCIIT